MNSFLVIQSILCVGAALFEVFRGNPKLVIVYLAWAVSNFTMAFIGGK